MTLLQEIGKAVADYINGHYGQTPDTVYLSRGMVGILRNELGIPDGIVLKKVMGLEIQHQPRLVVTRETVD